MVTLDQAGSSTNLSLLAPPPPLAAVVELAWIEETASTPTAGVRPWRIVPDDAPHLLWHRYDGARDSSQLMLVGARSVFTDIDKSGRTATVGVRLRSGAVPALFRIPAHEITDRVLDLESVIGVPARDVGEQLVNAPLQLATARIERLLLRLATRGRAVNPRATSLVALGDSGLPRVERIARALGVSQRTLRAIARDEIGLSARDVVRIRRLHHALRVGLANPRAWSRAAAAAGYVDQAHFTRECHALLGETPGAFAARARRVSA